MRSVSNWTRTWCVASSPNITSRGPLETDGPSWLTLLAQAKDSLWSVDLFRCESILLRSHWVMVVIDVFTRRHIGFGVEGGSIDGIAGMPHVQPCHPRNHPMPYSALVPITIRCSVFHRWLANLRVREIEEIKFSPLCAGLPSIRRSA